MRQGIIRVLPDQVINQISAGEVVDRPSSVVRELLDNSVDAGATEISVYLEEGGRSLVRVVDNGSGMERDDALLAFERHATSKIQSIEDLDRLNSLGFRGEALPSIASVSKVRLSTRTARAELGAEINIEGGKIKNVREVNVPSGTTVEVRTLFFNTPARRKFLKQPKTEELRIRSWILHSSLAHPDIRYRVFCDGTECMNLPRARSVLERAKRIFLGRLASGLREIPTCSISSKEVCVWRRHCVRACAGNPAQCLILENRSSSHAAANAPFFNKQAEASP